MTTRFNRSVNRNALRTAAALAALTLLSACSGGSGSSGSTETPARFDSADLFSQRLDANRDSIESAIAVPEAEIFGRVVAYLLDVDSRLREAADGRDRGRFDCPEGGSFNRDVATNDSTTDDQFTREQTMERRFADCRISIDFQEPDLEPGIVSINGSWRQSALIDERASDNPNLDNLSFATLETFAINASRNGNVLMLKEGEISDDTLIQQTDNEGRQFLRQRDQQRPRLEARIGERYAAVLDEQIMLDGEITTDPLRQVFTRKVGGRYASTAAGGFLQWLSLEPRQFDQLQGEPEVARAGIEEIRGNTDTTLQIRYGSDSDNNEVEVRDADGVSWMGTYQAFISQPWWRELN